jgi:hypothetical protein
MVWWRELKWLIATKFLEWTFGLIQEEADARTIDGFIKLTEHFESDTKWQTVKMRKVERV